ncbi:hypothetical protein PHMEG_00033703, partial [Phytophthora megakarya]
RHTCLSHAVYITSAGYFKLKCRTQRYKRFRGPVREPTSIFCCGVLNVASLRKCKSFYNDTMRVNAFRVGV